MRITSSTVAALLVAIAVPSFGFAQIVVAYPPGPPAHVARLDHAVPAATVTQPSDPIALANAKPGVDFVRGAATVNVDDPDHPKILFTVSNQTASPIPPDSVFVHVASVYPGKDGEPVVSLCGYSGRLSDMLKAPGSSAAANATLAPGATVTIAVPVGPGPCVQKDPQQNVGFLVHLTGDGTHHFAGDDVPRMREALAALRADAQQ
jgi:hypothetical protein